MKFNIISKNNSDSDLFRLESEILRGIASIVREGRKNLANLVEFNDLREYLTRQKIIFTESEFEKVLWKLQQEKKIFLNEAEQRRTGMVTIFGRDYNWVNLRAK